MSLKKISTHLYINAIEDVLLYSESPDDILPLVKKKLGIQ